MRPLHGQGFFVVDLTGRVVQIVRFDYYDERHEYADIYHDEERYASEVSRLAANMQAALDEEEVRINGEMVRPRVVLVNIEHSGSPELPHVTYVIEFHGRIHRGVNVYENTYPPERLDYDIEAYWVFPPGTRVLEFVGDMEYDVVGNVLYLWARRGDEAKGYERITFEIP